MSFTNSKTKTSFRTSLLAGALAKVRVKEPQHEVQARRSQSVARFCCINLHIQPSCGRVSAVRKRLCNVKFYWFKYRRYCLTQLQVYWSATFRKFNCCTNDFVYVYFKKKHLYYEQASSNCY